MKSNPLVTISVPVYNVEKYLPKCLDSLLNQTLNNIEIILVDDGSKDGSGIICDQYASKDDRIRVIHKENGGLASARQAALEVACGEYFCACDADDWVEPNMYDLMYNKAKETDADIVYCEYYSNYENGIVKEHHFVSDFDFKGDMLSEVLKGRFPHMVWNKLYRRSLFQKYSVDWQLGINMGEDFLLMLKLFRYQLNVVFLPKCLYHYRRVFNGSSYTNNVSLNSFKQSLAIRHWIDDNINSDKYSKEIFQLWVGLAFTGLRVTEGMTAEYYNTTLMPRLLFKRFIEYRLFNQKALIVLISKIMGYSLARLLCSHLYKFYYK